MLARDTLRDDTGRVERLLAARGVDPETLAGWRRLDAERRSVLVDVEEKKRRRHEASKEIGRVKSQGGDAAEQIAAVSALKAEIEKLESRVTAIDEEMATAELAFPNLCHESVPEGEDESANRVEQQWGEPPAD